MKSIHAVLLAIGGISLGVQAQDAPDGQALYQQFCAQCHGADLRGGNAQSMVDGVWQYGEGTGYITRNIKHGITDLGMPAYESSMSDAQIRAVVEFIMSAEKSTGAVKPPPPTEIQTQDYHVKVDQWIPRAQSPSPAPPPQPAPVA
ncbi:MAG TPA: cytochrome c, partial [Candidatus Hydrogenedentes bacterium]|nr:cytochrome c [Candidatus Hydrogenedentota bacterium]